MSKPVSQTDSIYFFRMPQDEYHRPGSIQCVDADVFYILKRLSSMTGMSLGAITCKLLRDAFARVRLVNADSPVTQYGVVSTELMEILRPNETTKEVSP